MPNVIVVGAKTYNEQERNLAYVAATRAKQRLYWCKALPNIRGKKRGTFKKNFKEQVRDDPDMIAF